MSASQRTIVPEDGGFFTTGLGRGDLPMFRVEQVQLNLGTAAGTTVVDLCVQNDVLILALSGARLIKINLANPTEPVDLDLGTNHPKTRTIYKAFLDPGGSHLIVTTYQGDNFYFSDASTKPRLMNRAKGHVIESLAWSPSVTPQSTNEVLVATRGGLVFETAIDAIEDWSSRGEERYWKQVWQFGKMPITGLLFMSREQQREGILLGCTARELFSFKMKLARHPSSSSSSTAGQFEHKKLLEFSNGRPNSSLVASASHHFGYISGDGILHGSPEDLGDLSLISYEKFAQNVKDDVPMHLLVTPYHCLVICGNTLYAINRFSERLVFVDQLPMSPHEHVSGLCADQRRSTYWIFTSTSIYEIVISDEDRDMWSFYLDRKDFDRAESSAKTDGQRDAIRIAHGNFAIANGDSKRAAQVLAASSKAFEDVALMFDDIGQRESLLEYLLTKLRLISSTATMQRTMLAAWITELYMAMLDTQDDSVKNQLSEEDRHRSTETRDGSANDVKVFFDKHKVMKIFKAEADKLAGLGSCHDTRNHTITWPG